MKFNDYWKPPKNVKELFSPNPTEEEKKFKEKYGILYYLLLIVGIIIVFVPVIIFFCIVPENAFTSSTTQNNMLCAIAAIIGMFGSSAIGFGFFNIYSVIMKQYLGHFVTITSIIGGVVLDAAALLLLNLTK